MGNRLLAICDFLASGNDDIVIGQKDLQQLVISGRPVSFRLPVALAEEEISSRRDFRKRSAAPECGGDEIHAH